MEMKFSRSECGTERSRNRGSPLLLILTLLLFVFLLGEKTVFASEVNTTPSVSGSSISIFEDATNSGNLLAGDADGDTVTYYVRSGPGHGTLDINSSTGGYTYTPTTGYSGSDSFTFYVNDGKTDSSDATINISIIAVNHAPTAESLSFTVSEDGTLSDHLNGTDSDGDSLIFKKGAGPPVGTFTFNEDGTFTYIPEVNYNGQVTFTYATNDGQVDSLTATVTITVTAVNDAPSFLVGSNQTVLEDTPLCEIVGWASAISAGPSDEAGQTLSFTVNTDNDALFSSLPFIDAATGKLTYKLAANQYGDANVTVTLTDSEGGTMVQTFVIHVLPVNDLPTFTKGGNITVSEDYSAYNQSWATDILAGENEIGQSMSFAVTTNNDALFLIRPSIASDGTLTFIPAPNANGEATVTVILSDDGGTDNGGVDKADTVTFKIIITPVNDAPTITSIGNQNISEDADAKTLSFTVNDIDNAESLLTIAATSSDTSIIPLSNIVIGGSGTSRNISFFPAENKFGTLTITVTVSDGDLQDVTQFTVNISSVNDLPRINQMADQTINEDVSTGNIEFTVDDVETDASLLNVSYSCSNTTLFPSGSIALSGSTDKRYIKLTPAVNLSGEADVTIMVKDTDGGTTQMSFHVEVDAVNDLPNLTIPSKQTIDEDTATNVLNITLSDVETAAGLINLMAISGNTSIVAADGIVLGGSGTNRTIQITPVANASGTVAITIRATDVDGGVTTKVLLIEVDAVNDAPVIDTITAKTVNEDETSTAFTFGVSDIDNNDAALVVTAISSNNSVIPTIGGIILGGSGGNRTISFIPAENAIGTVTITVTVSDGKLTSSTSFQVTVTNVNDAPYIGQIANYLMGLNAVSDDYPFSIYDIDNASGDLTLDAEYDPDLIANVTFGGSGSNRTIAFTTKGTAGTAQIKVNVRDPGGLYRYTTFLVVIQAGGPGTSIISQILGQSTPEDTESGYIYFDVDQNYGDHVVVSCSNPAIIANDYTHIILEKLNLNGTRQRYRVKFVPLTDMNGSMTMTVTVKNASDDTVTRDFSFHVTPINDEPVISGNDFIEVDEDHSIPVNSITISDVDVGDVLNISVTACDKVLFPDGNLTSTNTADGISITLTPALNMNGTTVINITVRDSGGAIVSRNFTVTVKSVNDAPTISTINEQTIDEDVPSSGIAFTVGDVELKAANLSVYAVSDNQFLIANNGLSFQGTGANRTLVITPVDNANTGAGDTVNITVYVSDGDSVSSTTFKVNISPVNDAPAIGYIANQTIYEDNSVGPISYTIGDIDSNINLVNVTATSNNTDLIPNNSDSIKIGGSGANRTITLTPDANANGTATITVKATDAEGAVSTRTFVFKVIAVNDLPVITSSDSISTNEDVDLNGVTIKISDLETDADSLTWEITSGNQTILPDANITKTYTPGGTITLNLHPALNQNGTVNLSIKVNDGTAITKKIITLTVNPVNDAPTISADSLASVALGNITINEDSATGVNHFYVGDVEKAAGSLVVTASSDATWIIPQSGIILGGSGADRTFQLVPLKDQFGTVHITITVSDGELTSTDTFTVTVLPVDDVPSFTKGFNVTVLEDSTAYSEDGWATAISKGPANENSQILDFKVSNNNNDLFSVQPYITADGKLAFTPAKDTFGTATVTVMLHDDGTTDNGGVDTSDAQTFTITITPVNDVPFFTGGADQSNTEDDPAVSIAGWATGIGKGPANEDGQTLEFIVTNDNNGMFAVQPAISPDGTLTYKLKANANGMATVTVKLHDKSGTANGGVDTSAAQTFTITVSAVNDAPVLSLLTRTGKEDTPLAFTVNDFTGKNSDPDVGDLLEQVKIVTLPDVACGVLKLDGVLVDAGNVINRAYLAKLSFVPVADWNGSVSFTWTATDGDAWAASNATATITLNAVNDIPSFTKGDDQTGIEDVNNSVTVNGWATNLLKGPNNESSQNLSFIVTNNNNAMFDEQPSIDASGNLTYKLKANANGTATVTVKIHDNGGTTDLGVDTSAAQTFTITIAAVNDAPEVSNFSKTGNEDSELLFSESDFTDACSDVDTGDTMTEIRIVTLPDADAGVLKLNGAIVNAGDVINAADLAKLTFKPVTDWNGSVSFTWKAYDGELWATSEATVSITINAVDDVPSFTKGADQTGTEDLNDAVTVNGWATNLVKGPANENGQKLNFIVTNNNNALFAVQPAIDANGNLTYTIKANANGTAIVTVKLHDDGTTANSGIDTSSEQTFTITVGAVNDAPVLSTITKTGNEDAIIHFTASDFTDKGSDPDLGDLLEKVQIVTLPNAGSGVLLLSGVAVNAGDIIDLAELSGLSFVPVTDWNGSISITWNATDGELWAISAATLTIKVNAVNDVPSFTKGANLTLNEDDSAVAVNGWATNLVKGPTNENSQTLHFNVTNSNNNLFTVQPSIDAFGNLTYKLKANANGTATVTVRIQDDGGTAYSGVDTSAAQTFTITVVAVNDAPVVTAASVSVNEDITYSFGSVAFTGHYSDVENDSLKKIMITGIMNSSIGTLYLDSTPIYAGQEIDVTLLSHIKFVPSENWNGSTTFTWKGYDGTVYSAEATMTINVTAVNDAPVCTVAPVIGTTAQVGSSTAGDNGSWNDLLDTSIHGGTTTITYTYLWEVANDESGSGTTSLGVTTKNFTPTSAQAHKYIRLKVTATDNGIGAANASAVSCSEWIRVENTAPVVSDFSVNTSEDTAYTFAVADFNTKYSDADTDSMTKICITYLPAHGTLKLNGAVIAEGAEIATADISKLTFIPDLDWNGSTSFTWNGQDGTTYASIAKTVTISIAAVNDAPVANADSITATEDTVFNGTLTGSDIEGSSLTYQLISNATHGNVVLNLNGSYVYTPSGNYFGSDSFTFRVNDGGLNSATVTISVTVTPRNDAPVSLVVPMISGMARVGGSLSSTTGTWTDAADTDVHSDLTILTYTYQWEVADDVAGHGLTPISGATLSSITLTSNMAHKYIRVRVTATDDGIGATNESTIAYSSWVAVANSVPTVTDIAVTTDEDISYHFKTADFTDKFSDTDSDGMTKIKIITLPVNASLKLDGVAISVGQEILYSDLTKLTITPSANWNGSTSFTWNASDASAYAATNKTVTITVSAVNDAPVYTVAPSFSGTARIGYEQTGLAGVWNDLADTSVYGIPTVLSYSYQWQMADNLSGDGLQSIAGANGLNFTPTALQGGKYIRLAVTVTDDGIGTGIGTATAFSPWVRMQNAAPVVSNITVTADEDNVYSFKAVDFTGKYSDPDSDPLAKIKIVTLPTHGSLKLGTALITEGDEIALSDLDRISFTPDLNWNGVISFAWNANDGVLYAIADKTVTITIHPVNDAPENQKKPSITGSFHAGIEITADKGIWNDTKDTSVSAGLHTTLSYAYQWQLASDSSGTGASDIAGANSLTYRPTATQAHKYLRLKVTASDDGIGSGSSVTVAYSEWMPVINAAPVVSNITMLMDEDGKLTFKPTDFSDHYTDSDNDPMFSVTIVTLPNQATLYLNNDPVIAGTEITAAQLNNLKVVPVPDMNGVISFQWKAYDSDGYSNIANVNISVRSINDTPEMTKEINVTIPVNTEKEGIVTAKDVDKDSIIYTASAPSNGTAIVDSTTGLWKYTPDKEYVGIDSFRITADDGHGGTAVTTVNITVVGSYVIHMSANPISIVGNGKDTTTLTITVTDRNNKPIPGVKLTYSAECGSFIGGTEGVTDKNGVATVEYRSEKLESNTRLSIPVTVTAYDKERDLTVTESITVTFEPGAIVGVVCDNETGKPIDGAVVEVSKDFDNDGVIDFYAKMTTGADGKYKIAVPKGNVDYNIKITKPVMVGKTAKKVTFEQDGHIGDVTGAGSEEYSADETAAGMIMLVKSNGKKVLFDDYSGFSVDIYNGKELLSSGVDTQVFNNDSNKGVYSIAGLEPGKEYQLKVKYTLPDGEQIVVGNMNINISENGEMNLSSTLIDPYGIIKDAVTGKLVSGVHVKLYYADTKRNRKAGREPGTLVELPIIKGFEPFDNRNPQTSDSYGKYAYMVFPYTDYYIIAEKDGYQTYTSPVISVEEEIVKFDFKISKEKSKEELIVSTAKRNESIQHVNGAPKTGETNTGSEGTLIILAVLSLLSCFVLKRKSLQR